MNTIKTKKKVLAIVILAAAALGGVSYYALSKDNTAGPETGAYQFSPEEMNEGTADDIAGLSLAEAKKRINYLITETQDFINTIEMIQNLKLKIVPAAAGSGNPAAQELHYEPPFIPFTSEDIGQALAGIKARPVGFYQALYSRDSTVRLLTDSLDGIWKRAQTPDDNQVEQYRIDRVYFRDGTEEAFSAVAGKGAQANGDHNAYATSDHINLSVNKPLDKIKVTIRYQSYPHYKKVVLDKDHPKVAFDGGEFYQLTAIAGHSASLILARPKDASYLVQGMSVTPGKPLRNSGHSASSRPSEQDYVNVKKYERELLDIKRDFSQFKHSQQVQDRLAAFAKGLPIEKSHLKNERAEYDFEDVPQSIVIYVLDPLREDTVEWDMTNVTPVQERYIAYDRATDKAGFVDKNGRWLIKPTFINADYTELEGVYRIVVKQKPTAQDSSETIVKYYYFVPGTLSFKPFPFDNIEKKINDHLLLVEREINGPYGIYDIKQQKFTVPMKFVDPSITGDILIARVGDKTYESKPTYGAYTLAGGQILPPKYDQMRQDGNFIYATSADKRSQDVFDLTGQKLNPKGYNVIDAFAGQQPLLVQNANSKKYGFINQRGSLLPIDLPYDEVQPFSNGMAVVGKEGKSGAIDLAGALRVPVEYESIAPYQKNLAAARPIDFDGLVLIDKNNTQVKKLGAYTQFTAGANGNDAKYHIIDPQDENKVIVYDADGNILETFNNQ